MKIEAEELKEIAIEILRGLKASEDEAALVAESLVQADMRGIDTHGVHFLTLLARRVDAGMIQIPTRVAVVKDEGAIAHLDGQDGLGQVAARRAMELCIQKAKAFGVGTVFVRNTNHVGILAFYGLMAAKQNMVGIAMCNAAASIAPWGGTRPFFGTNPMSIAIPGGSRDPVVLDMASSVVARGKIRRAERQRESIPPGWAFDESGSPTTDAAAAMKGTLMPIGGPKGYGLALMIDLLSGLLSGSLYGPQVKTFHEPLGPTGVGMCAMAIDVSRFMPLEQFSAILQGHLDHIRASEKAPGVARIYLPGEIEAEKAQKAARDGVDVSEATVRGLDELLARVKSPRRLAERAARH